MLFNLFVGITFVDWLKNHTLPIGQKDSPAQRQYPNPHSISDKYIKVLLEWGFLSLRIFIICICTAPLFVPIIVIPVAVQVFILFKNFGLKLICFVSINGTTIAVLSPGKLSSKAEALRK